MGRAHPQLYASFLRAALDLRATRIGKGRRRLVRARAPWLGVLRLLADWRRDLHAKPAGEVRGRQHTQHGGVARQEGCIGT